MNTRELAERAGIARGTLRWRRSMGLGPLWHHEGKAVVYDDESAAEWLEARRKPHQLSPLDPVVLTAADGRDLPGQWVAPSQVVVPLLTAEGDTVMGRMTVPEGAAMSPQETTNE